MFSHLNTLSPLDGRYRKKVEELTNIFSEKSLIQYRIYIEICWLKELANTMPEQLSISDNGLSILDNITTNFSEKDAEAVKAEEERTNHDVKAVEYFINKQLDKHEELARLKQWVHFGTTSEDINNLAYALMLKKSLEEIIFPTLNKLLISLKTLAHDYADIAMLAKTHGQAATPTTVGKEFANFAYRIEKLIKNLQQVELCGKLNGATGNYSALKFVTPNVNWEEVSRRFVEDLGLVWNPYTTQIEPHDYMATLFNEISHLNTVLLGLSKDIWSYNSIDYFKQKAVVGQVGSSTMPHKINPIDFENAEGNVTMANALLKAMSEKLPVSRWQRDLSDSTVLRNIGVAFGYTLLVYKSFLSGISKLTVNKEKITEDLKDRWELLAEPIQTSMRFFGVKNSYEKLRDLTRGQQITKKQLDELIDDTPELPGEEKERLHQLTPSTYLGNAASLAKKI